ncbi:MAG TPA: hypothetical protein VJG90_08130 [Candidatus Nanoarchaeia archaeon]|nr:hypothetical protein [Candidatus Nanoarchaeia archaeon]
MEDRLQKILLFLEEIDAFKSILRSIYLSDLSRKESDAEHIVNCAT